jgi:CNT family concentrative nucleoside transporter
MELMRGAVGVIFVVALAWTFSVNRKGVRWRTVAAGLILQFGIGLLVLKAPLVYEAFRRVAGVFDAVLGFTEKGAGFLFGGLTDVNTSGFIFAVRVLPVIIFFSSLTSLLYYLGVLQRVVLIFAWVMRRTLGVSGAESLNAAGNVMLGQTEAPFLIKPFIPEMRPSQILCVMVGGMATIAGSVMGAYVLFLGGDDPERRQYFATHLLAASIMNAPAAIVVAKLLYPDDNRTGTDNLDFNREQLAANPVDAIALGAADGLKLAANVGAMLLAFIAVIAMFNTGLREILGQIPIGERSLNDIIRDSTGGLFDGLTLQYLLGQIFRPIAFIIGVDWSESLAVGSLLGEKVVVNEFVAYKSLSGMQNLSEKSRLISAYALCGFANFSSIAIQIGGLGSMAPNQRPLISKLGIRAVLGGTMAGLLTATLAGALT